MKTKISFLFLLLMSCFIFTNCSEDDNDRFLNPIEVTVPVIKSKTAIRNSIEVLSAQPTNADGKIYVYDDLLFYIAQNSGIHIFNNQNPASPQNLAFIKLEGVNDISVKNSILYADNYMDLVVFDLSDVTNIELLNIQEDMLTFYAIFPNEFGTYIQNIYPSSEDEFIASYENVMMEKTLVENNADFYNYSDIFTFDNALANSVNIGVGGSYAKFQIYDNALYVLEDYKLDTFDISDIYNITHSSETYVGNWLGGELETTFIQKNYLFIGATNGMHIVSLEDEFTPAYVSSFLHATGCDPVVVEGNTAYITVRGGNTCGAIEDQVNVIDVSDIANPIEYSTYFLSSPYGLGVKNQVLYVCNDTGIHVFDAQNPNVIVLENSYDAIIKDVIALPSHLIGVGENVIYQYNYTDNFGLDLISTTGF
jgi:hypothetical protein